ncbi:MAG: isoprenyl transferase [Desulfobacterales bacterium]|nr:isoprenyl transferase [Desulfobacterales bacterium]
MTTYTKKKRKKSLSFNFDLDPKKIPVHVAIIMDGNGRWAKKRLLNRTKGHEKGAEAVRTVVRTSRELGVKYLTLYAFSTENWERPAAEIATLMFLLKKFLKNELKELQENNIRLNAIGQIDRLNLDVQEELNKTMDLTKNNTGMCLNLALSYGGRSEIIRMVHEVSKKVKDGAISISDITEELISKHLYTFNIPDPDLLIRTSGEMRISNFLLWQIAYCEIFVTETLWPDFSKEEYIKILRAYQNRERRFGKV